MVSTAQILVIFLTINFQINNVLLLDKICTETSSEIENILPTVWTNLAWRNVHLKEFNLQTKADFHRKLMNMSTDYGIFLGKSLRENSFEYPDPLAGFSISRELFNNLLIEHNEFKFLRLQQVTHFSTYFLAGAVYQLASFLENDERFCTQYAEECAIYPKDVSCETSQEKAER